MSPPSVESPITTPPNARRFTHSGMLKVYIACALAQAETACRIAGLLGPEFRVVSRWHWEVVKLGAKADPPKEADRIECLLPNLDDIERSDVVLVLAHIGQPRATYSEIGYAIRAGKRILWVHAPDGTGRNIFDAHGLVKRIPAGSGLIEQICAELRATPARMETEWRRG